MRSASVSSLQQAADNEALAWLAATPHAGRLPSGITLYISVMYAEQMTGEALESFIEHDEGMTALMDAMGDVCDAHQRPQGWPVGEGPEEFQALQREWLSDCRGAHAYLLESVGQTWLAEKLRCDPDTYYLICEEAGRDFAQFLER